MVIGHTNEMDIYRNIRFKNRYRANAILFIIKKFLISCGIVFQQFQKWTIDENKFLQ